MSFRSLLNKRCSWKRRSYVQDNAYGEPIYTETIVQSDVRCRFEDIEGWHFWEAEPGGDFSRKKKLLYLEYGADIQRDDRIIFEGSDNYWVIDPDDAAGHNHHLEVRVEQTRDT